MLIRSHVVSTLALTLSLIISAEAPSHGESRNSDDQQLVSWSEEAIASAGYLQTYQKRLFEDELDKLSESGASVIRVEYLGDTNRTVLAGYAEFSEYLQKYQLVGYGSWGVKVTSSKVFPDLSMDPSHDLTKLKSETCSLGFNLFNWDSWFTPGCEVKQVDPETYLDAALLERLSWPVDQTIVNRYKPMFDAMVDGRLEYTIDAGAYICPGLLKEFGTNSFSVSFIDIADGHGYRVIQTGPGKWDLKFQPLAGDPESLAYYAHEDMERGLIVFENDSIL